MSAIDPHPDQRTLIKRLFDGLAIVLVAPVAALYHVARRVAPGRSDTAIQGFSQFLSLCPGLIGVFLRRAFYRLTLEECSPTCSVGFGTLLVTPRIRIGAGVYIGVGCNISHCTIGPDVLIGSHVSVIAGKHIHRYDRSDVPIRHQGGTVTPIQIGEDVWIGNGAIVMSDVGAHAVIAAGAVVVKPVAPYDVVGGNPARVIATRNDHQIAPAAARSSIPSPSR